MNRTRSSRAVYLALALVGFVGCDRRDEKITVYRVEKAPLESTPPAKMDPVAMPPGLPMSNPVAGRPVPTGSVPPHWEAQPPSQMRQASYIVHGENGTSADISLVTLGTTAGNVLDNVNRWLGQLGQPPITDAQLPQIVQHLPGDADHVAVVDLQGKPEQGDATKDGRILAAMGTAENGTSFFKMRGNAELVGAEKENFLKWVADFKK